MTATTICVPVSNGIIRNSDIAVAASSPWRGLLVALVAACGALVASSASAVDVNVTNYSWLQLPSSDVTPFIGSANNVTASIYGETSDFRWGDYVWLPTNAMTANASQMYYAGVRLDQARPVSSVRVQWWIPTNSFSVSQYHIDSSNDGLNWTNIGNGGTVVDNQGTVTNLPVTPGNYQYVRVRLEGGEYSNGGNGSYGGPGLYLIDPIGSGTVAGDQINWANAQLGTSVVNNGLSSYNSTTHNSGELTEYQANSNWTGSIGTAWPVGSYTQVNLAGDRLLGSASAIWSNNYAGNHFDLEYSPDGTNFYPVANDVLSQFSTANSIGATEMTFDPVIAKAIRMRNASGTNGPSGYNLINQLLLHGPTDGVLGSNPGANGTITLVGDGNALTTTVAGAVTLENTGGAESAIGIFGYTITGLDAAEFDLSNFAATVLLSGENAAFDIEFTSPTMGPLSALLTFSTSVGDIAFNLQAVAPPAPEPSTVLLLGLGCLVPLVRRRRK